MTPRCKMVSGWHPMSPMMASSWLQDGPKWPQDLLTWPRIGFWDLGIGALVWAPGHFYSFALVHPILQMMAQGAPKMVSTWPSSGFKSVKMAPRWPKYRPKIAEESIEMASRSPEMASSNLGWPETSLITPKWARFACMMASKATKVAARWL